MEAAFVVFRALFAHPLFFLSVLLFLLMVLIVLPKLTFMPSKKKKEHPLQANGLDSNNKKLSL